jgi:hypothetical protein
VKDARNHSWEEICEGHHYSDKGDEEDSSQARQRSVKGISTQAREISLKDAVST